MTLLLCLFIGIDPSSAALDRLQGTWHGINGTTLVIDGDRIPPPAKTASVASRPACASVCGSCE
jgi:hypothetical protein